MPDEDRYWLKYYPEGIPADIDSSAYHSLLDMLRESVHKHSDRPAYYHIGTTISYRELDELTHRFSSSLQQLFNVHKGDRIALMLPNTLAHPIAMFGIFRAGGIVVNVNPLYTPRELELQLVDSGARVIVVLDLFTEALSKIIEKTAIEHVITVRVGDGHPAPKRWLINLYTRFIKKYKAAPGLESVSFDHCLRPKHNLPDADLEQTDTAYLQYTGGTTGISKGAILTHGNILSNAIQGLTWMSPAFHKPYPRIVAALPLYHIFALLANGYITMGLGGCCHLITNPRDMKGFLKELEKVEFNAITGVNTLFNAMLNHPGFSKLDFSHLELTLAGGMAVLKATADAWHERTGTPIVEAYGLTESSPALTANPVDIDEYNGTIGMPLPSTEISIRDDDGKAIPLGTEGELWARGPQIMAGYWNKPQETRDVLTSDGWLKTGDIATMDEKGYVRIVDRKKDMIIISGFNVYPNEIEDILMMHPHIREVGVVGVPSKKTGEAVKAVIVSDDKTLTEDQVIAYCRQQLTPYKVPKIIEFRDELPKTNVGKILRRSLR